MYSLKAYNTFGIEVFTSDFIEINSLAQLQDTIKSGINNDFFIIGGGSNLLLTNNINKKTLFINIKGIQIIKEENQHIYIKANAGENWHQFVLNCVNNNYGGIENLSLIPGNVGTTPVQNIGAYGVEIKDVMHSCDAVNIQTGECRIFTNEECKFNYRESIFKNELKGKYIITAVTFKLTKSNHNLHTKYGAIEDELKRNNIINPTIKDISNAVIEIRKSKLPDPKEIGNSGSFFKNPIISITDFKKTQNLYPEIPHYIVSDTEIKVPAGWLIEKAGFKGFRRGDAGVHTKQALVLVNYANATGKEILDLAHEIQNSILEKFNIKIEMEVNVI